MGSWEAGGKSLAPGGDWWPRGYLELSHHGGLRPPSEAELVRWREEARTCQGCKLCDKKASIPDLVMATFGYWWQRLATLSCN